MRSIRKVYVRKALFVSKLVLALLLGQGVVRTVLVVLGTVELMGPVSAVGGEDYTAVVPTDSRGLSAVDYASVIKGNIFHGAGSPSAACEWAAAESQAHRMSTAGPELGLVLLGTVSGKPLISRAIIKDLETNILGLYRPGDTVATANIERIEADRVILSHQGQKKLLNIGNAAPQGHDEVYSASGGDDAPGVAVIRDDFAEEQATIVNARLVDIDTVLRKAAIKPYIVGDRMDGIRISRVEDLKAAKALGLKNGDVIISVNGHRLTSKQKAYQVFKKARSQPIIDIELLRDNEAKTLSFLMR
jgi:type II secretion system protein C